MSIISTHSKVCMIEWIRTKQNLRSLMELTSKPEMLSFWVLLSTPKAFIPTSIDFPPLGFSMNAAMDMPSASSKRHIVLMSCTNKGSFFASTNETDRKMTKKQLQWLKNTHFSSSEIILKRKFFARCFSVFF